MLALSVVTLGMSKADIYEIIRTLAEQLTENKIYFIGT